MYACRFGEDAYAWYKRGSHEGWKPDADMYELLLNWMCTQENLIDEAETIVRLEMLVGSEHSCFTEHTCRPWGGAHMHLHIQVFSAPDLQSGLGIESVWYCWCRRMVCSRRPGTQTP